MLPLEGFYVLSLWSIGRWKKRDSSCESALCETEGYCVWKRASITAKFHNCIFVCVRLDGSVSLLFPGSVCRGNDSCGQRCRLCWWFTRNSPGMPHRTRRVACMSLHYSARKCLLMHPCERETYLLGVCAHSCVRVRVVPGSGEVLSTHGGPLSARWMVSASVREVTAGRPGLSWPRVWILSSDSSWQLLMGDTSSAPPLTPTHPWACIMETPAFSGKSMMSHSEL